MNATLKRRIHTYSIMALTAVTFAAGCGSRSYQAAQQNAQAGAASTDAAVVVTDASGQTIYGSDASNTVEIGGATESFSIALTGDGGTTPTATTPAVYTDNLLRVKIKPQGGENMTVADGTYTNMSSGYGCVQFTVTVLGQSVQTQVLAVEGRDNKACPNAPKAQIIDFSGRLSPGHGPITVTVSKARNDRHCQSWIACRNYEAMGYRSYTCTYNYAQSLQAQFCPVRAAYMYDTMNASLEIQVNGGTL